VCARGFHQQTAGLKIGDQSDEPNFRMTFVLSLMKAVEQGGWKLVYKDSTPRVGFDEVLWVVDAPAG
jgi:hypothetical protein